MQGQVFDPTVTLGNILTMIAFLVGVLVTFWRASARLTDIVNRFDRRLASVEDWMHEARPKVDELLVDKIARDAVRRAHREFHPQQQEEPTKVDLLERLAKEAAREALRNIGAGAGDARRAMLDSERAGS